MLNISMSSDESFHGTDNKHVLTLFTTIFNICNNNFELRLHFGRNTQCSERSENPLGHNICTNINNSCHYFHACYIEMTIYHWKNEPLFYRLRRIHKNQLNVIPLISMYNRMLQVIGIKNLNSSIRFLSINVLILFLYMICLQVL